MGKFVGSKRIAEENGWIFYVYESWWLHKHNREQWREHKAAVLKAIKDNTPNNTYASKINAVTIHPLRFDIAGGQCGVSYWKKSVINAIQIGRDKTIEGFLNGRSAEASVAPANGSQETLVDPGAAPDAA